MRLREYICQEVHMDGMPACILFMLKAGTEFLFKLLGYFIALSLLVGLTLTACPKNLFLQALPLVAAFLFFLYINITLIAMPSFALTESMGQSSRRIFRFSVLIFVMIFTIYLLLSSTLFELLVAYVAKLFPHTFDCHGGLMEITRPN